MKAKLINVKVRRDAHTISPTVVAEHELPILQTIFGDENIQTLAGGPIDASALKETDAAGVIELSDSEFDRLAAKYGANEKGVIVEQVYGTKAARGLDKVIKENSAAILAAEKKAAASATKSGTAQE